jgi:hypothetical protein
LIPAILGAFTGSFLMVELFKAFAVTVGALLNAMRAIPNTENNPDLAKIRQFYRDPAKLIMAHS